MFGSRESNASEERGRRRIALIAAGILLVVGFAVGLYWPSGETAEEGAARTAAVPAPPEASAPEAAAETPETAPEEAPPPAASRRARRAPSPAPAAEPAREAAPTVGTVLIDADVAGASVFLDRQYVGTTPATIENVTPGSHQLNVSVQGYDGIAQTIDVPAGPSEVMIRFKEVRLNEAIEVVHKHRMGSCRGRLVASVDGLRYETDNANDGFTLPFARLETFEIDYLDKTLRVKVAGGRTYNFTDPEDNADRLFVFHREVEKARERLASR